jgi:uncharacterized protein YndB with AHSA1/START domain
MKTLKFETVINASPEKVWQTLWNDTTYRHWTSEFTPGSYTVSQWKQGDKIHFLSPDGGGMYSNIHTLEENKSMVFEHIGELKNFEEQPLTEETKKWSGCTEKYTLTQQGDHTHLLVEVDALDDFAGYFEDMFPRAIDKLKQLAEEAIKPLIFTIATINAPLEKVWELWTNPEHITKWNFASNDWHSPSAENDLKVGGSFKYTMAAKDGSVSFDFAGVYDAIEKNKTIQYTTADGRKVSVSFQENNGGVKIVQWFEPESINSHELQRGGWQAILNNFKAWAEK